MPMRIDVCRSRNKISMSYGKCMHTDAEAEEETETK
jgi:hypothetical protein